MNFKGYCGTEYDLIFSESWNINRINLKRPKNKIKLYDWKEFQKQAKLNINILKERIARSQLSTAEIELHVPCQIIVWPWRRSSFSSMKPNR